MKKSVENQSKLKRSVELLFSDIDGNQSSTTIVTSLSLEELEKEHVISIWWSGPASTPVYHYCYEVKELMI